MLNKVRNGWITLECFISGLIIILFLTTLQHMNKKIVQDQIKLQDLWQQKPVSIWLPPAY